MTKKCSCCGETKDASEFYKHKRNKDGLGHAKDNPDTLNRGTAELAPRHSENYDMFHVCYLPVLTKE
jgi:hypothetical protein